jgi:hypothetical protein
VSKTSTRAIGAAAVAAIALSISGCAGEPASTVTTPVEEVSAATNGEVLDLIDQSGHQLREVPAEGAPGVAIEVTEDAKSGWNIRVDTTNFNWAPEHASTEAQPGEGHAHLMIDGKKYTRIYGDWFYLPATALTAGEHEVMVSLSANDHTTYAVDSKPVAAATMVMASGEGDGHTGHSHDS